METGQKEHDLPILPADKVLFRNQVQRELDEIRQEAEDAYVLDKMSVYGDIKVIYGASLGNGQKDKGTCEITDLVELVHFLPMLKTLCSQ